MLELATKWQGYKTLVLHLHVRFLDMALGWVREPISLWRFGIKHETLDDYQVGPKFLCLRVNLHRAFGHIYLSTKVR